eukprot:TRINITY_DN1734_c0_g1_i2.p1 TRINITY_DN1734_c0_g1~~TRINITY_DN1734_c0_g1_i2.p1  ORF type:complete len:892 (+),score=352.06 TRINITY_DN1734_c0_g1_i2:1366-4041(+)
MMSELFEFVTSSGGINEWTLKSNGLRVLLLEDHSAPVAASMVTYHVGSRNEAVGYTGSTHLLEHLMFKGSKDFNKDKNTSIWTLLQNVGAQINATTWLDRTNYYELLPKAHLHMALRIEADRMRNAFLRDNDRKPEMTVVRNEFEQGENNPFSALYKALWAAAYTSHPYHHPTIGWRSDIENVSIERLREFYNTFYHPNNATVIIVGDTSAEEALPLVADAFGAIPRSPSPIPEMYTTEPPQEGQRRVIVKRAGQLGFVAVAYKSPPGLHSDTHALKVLRNVLAFGKTSRLYKAIVDKGLATSVDITASPFRDAGLYVVYAQLTKEAKHEEVERIIVDEIERVQTDGVSDDEVARAQAQLETDFVFSRDGALSVASYLNEAIAIGDWKAYTEMIPKLRSVTAASVRAAAAKYLVVDQSTVGYFIPKAKEDKQPQPEDVVPPPAAEAAATSSPQSVPPPSRPVGSLGSRVADSRPIDGTRVLSLNTGIKEVITIEGSILAGHWHSPKSNPKLAALVCKMLDQGTKKHTKFEISELLGNVGARISFSVTSFHLQFWARCLRKDVPLVVGLIAEMLREPAFNADDFETTRTRKVSDLEQEKQRTRARAEIAFAQQIYPVDHPNYKREIDADIDDVRAATVADLHQFHADLYGLGNLIVAAAGDVEHEVLCRAVADSFAGWRVSPARIGPLGSKALQLDAAPAEARVFVADKTAIDVAFGQPTGIDREHPDYLALELAVYILGGNFSARLMQTVRDQDGLTYGISARQYSSTFADGHWAVWASFAPTLLERGRESTFAQLEKWFNDGVTAEELRAKKDSIKGSYQVSLAKTTGLAENMARHAERGKAPSYLDTYVDDIESLTLEQVNGALRKYVKLPFLAIAASGTFQEEKKNVE